MGYLSTYGVERAASFEEAGPSEYKADFVFDGIPVHVCVTENGDWSTQSVVVAGGELGRDIDDEFLHLFSEVAKSALFADEACLTSGGMAEIHSGWGGLTEEKWERLYQTYRDFYFKYSSKTGKQ